MKIGPDLCRLLVVRSQADPQWRYEPNEQPGQGVATNSVLSPPKLFNDLLRLVLPTLHESPPCQTSGGETLITHGSTLGEQPTLAGLASQKMVRLADVRSIFGTKVD
jgi:hypothetical protein